MRRQDIGSGCTVTQIDKHGVHEKLSIHFNRHWAPPVVGEGSYCVGLGVYRPRRQGLPLKGGVGASIQNPPVRSGCRLADVLVLAGQVVQVVSPQKCRGLLFREIWVYRLLGEDRDHLVRETIRDLSYRSS